MKPHYLFRRGKKLFLSRSAIRAGNNKFSLRSMSARESKLLLSIADFIRVILKFITVNLFQESVPDEVLHVAPRSVL